MLPAQNVAYRVCLHCMKRCMRLQFANLGVDAQHHIFTYLPIIDLFRAMGTARDIADYCHEALPFSQKFVIICDRKDLVGHFFDDPRRRSITFWSDFIQSVLGSRVTALSDVDLYADIPHTVRVA